MFNEVIPSTVAVFTDSFGALNAQNRLSLYYESICMQLKESGHSITVVYTGPENHQFSKIAAIYRKQGLNVIR